MQNNTEQHAPVVVQYSVQSTCNTHSTAHAQHHSTRIAHAQHSTRIAQHTHGMQRMYPSDKSSQSALVSASAMDSSSDIDSDSQSEQHSRFGAENSYSAKYRSSTNGCFLK